MKLVSFHVGLTPGFGFSDFHLGRYRLARHLGTKLIGVLDVDPKYARQLLLAEPSDFPSGRVPLYVCECCADLDCGAITVKVVRAEDAFVWSDFAHEAPHAEGPAPSTEVLRRTGPFAFDATQYRSALQPYARSRR